MKFKDYLTETTLSRVWIHANNKEIPVAIITAFRGSNTEKKNIQLNRSLAADIKNAGYGYFFLEGYWIENVGTEDEKGVSESSIFIVGNKDDNGKLVGLIKRWIIEYKQEAALIKREDTDVFEIIFGSGKSDSIGKLKPNTLGDIYSKIRRGNRSFVFEDKVILPGNWFTELESRR
jgi:hypothetical protein